MSAENKKGKHLTLADRATIEHCLLFGWSLTDIAARLGKDPTTVSKEIRNNRMQKSIRGKLACVHKQSCLITNVCSQECGLPCARCRFMNCTRYCSRYEQKQCSRLTKYPYVCNGCENSGGCMHTHFRYTAKVADANYQETLRSSRQGVDLTTADLRSLDDLISPLVKNGQSIYHILTSHKGEIGCSQRTIYNYFEKGFFSAKNLDLPRKVVYKKRKKTGGRMSSPASVQKHSFGRTYEDFLDFLEQHPGVSVVEMDTVKGKREKGKAILTLFFRNCSFMLAFLLDSCSRDCVKRVFESLYTELGHDVFASLFSILLTDNGSEFKAPQDIELTPDGRERAKVFFCDPMNSNQKSRLEKNHEYLRYIFRKGLTLDPYSQEDVTLAINHINSVARASLNGNCPYKLAQLLLDHSLFENFDLTLVPADDVVLKPLLLKK